jgi:hypothetical protein
MESKGILDNLSLPIMGFRNIYIHVILHGSSSLGLLTDMAVFYGPVQLQHSSELRDIARKG